MIDLFNNTNSLEIPDLWLLVATFIISVLIVYLIEYLKRPSAKIELSPNLVINDGKRKFLKVKVKIYKSGWFKKIFPWQNPASFARLKCYLIDSVGKEEIEIFAYIAKWDTRPEPWDYEKNIPKLELLPATSEPENFLVGDEGVTSIAAKHIGEDHFYVYDGNYYANQNGNIRNEKKIKLRLVFFLKLGINRKRFCNC